MRHYGGHFVINWHHNLNCWKKVPCSNHLVPLIVFSMNTFIFWVLLKLHQSKIKFLLFERATVAPFNSVRLSLSNRYTDLSKNVISQRIPQYFWLSGGLLLSRRGCLSTKTAVIFAIHWVIRSYVNGLAIWNNSGPFSRECSRTDPFRSRSEPVSHIPDPV